MGLSIGGITGPLAALRSSPDFGQARLGARRDPTSLPGAQEADDNGRGPFFNRPEPRRVQVGIGQGLSPQGAALRTIKATIENTRRTIPNFEDIRERFINASSARRDEAQRASIERTERSLTRRIESRIPEASAQARNFTSGLDETDDTTRVRLDGNPAQAQAVTQARAETTAAFEPTVDTEAAGPAVPIDGQQSGFGTSENAVRLDVSI